MSLASNFALKLFTAACLCSLATIVGGCSGADAAKKKSIQEYEESFDPAKYRDPDEQSEEQQEPLADTVPDTEKKVEYITIERIEKVMGYRIQIFSTTSLEDAEQRRDEFSEILGDTTKIVIVFDAPYYKIRIGDYMARKEADADCLLLKEQGLKEAWVVRDRVDKIIKERVIKRR